MTEEQALALLFRHWKEDQEKQPFPAWLPLTPDQLERRADLLRWILPAIIEAAGIVPEALRRLTQDPDREVAKRVTEAMMKMVKLDVAELEAAARG